MKLFSAISIAFLFSSSLIAGRGYQKIAVNEPSAKQQVAVSEVSDFDKAVEIIKKYETLHSARHWPLVGYGHKVLPGEKYRRGKTLSEKEADALLRKDLLKNCAVFRSFGADSLLLGVLAYNIGSGAAMRSAVARKLKAGDRDIFDSYVAHSKYRGKTHKQIKNRRIEEFEQLFITEEELVASTDQSNSKAKQGNAASDRKSAPDTKKSSDPISAAIYFDVALPDRKRNQFPEKTHYQLACLSKSKRSYILSQSACFA